VFFFNVIKQYQYCTTRIGVNHHASFHKLCEQHMHSKNIIHHFAVNSLDCCSSLVNMFRLLMQVILIVRMNHGLGISHVY
jgi:hypothetical protein